MFDLGAMELLVIVIVAVIVIGPKDMPKAMRTAGRWIGKVRKVSTHFRTGIDAMVREAEIEDMETKWKARNEQIMREHPPAPPSDSAGASAEARLTSNPADSQMEGPPPSSKPDIDADAQQAPKPKPKPQPKPKTKTAQKSAPAPDAPASDKA